jgi:D-alanyl-D-alanine carboxypeptidase
MNRIRKSIIAAILPVFLLIIPGFCSGESAFADSLKFPLITTPDVRFYSDPYASLPVQENEVKAGLLYDAINKKIVWQKNSTSVLPVASLTKMMVALLAIEDLRSGKYTWNDTLTWSRNLALGRRSRRKVVKVTSQYTFQDVFKAMMIASDNQCAEQMATYLGNGDLQATIQRMNLRALELGMTSTIYRNPSGLPAAIPSLDNASSPLDQLILGLELLNYQEVLDITSMGYALVNNGKHGAVLRNHNGLTIQHPGEIDGLKTGYTKRAGFCLVGTSSKCNHRLVAVVLGCRGPAIRNEVVRDMFNSYYASIGVDAIGNYAALQTWNTSTLPSSQAGQWVTVRDQIKNIHIVRQGENLSRIAQHYHCSTTQLKSWNRKKIPSSGRLKAGQSLAVYTATTRKVWMNQPDNGDEVSEDQSNTTDVAMETASKENNVCNTGNEAEEKQQKSLNSKFIYHVVAPGDTLYSIARKYGLPTVKQLKELNHIGDHRSLKPGMKLKVKVEAGT